MNSAFVTRETTLRREIERLKRRGCFNLGANAHYCRNPNDTTLQLFDSLEPHLEMLPGPIRGGYGAATLNMIQAGVHTDV